LQNFLLNGGQTVKLSLWFRKVKNVNGNNVDYDPIANDPQVVLSGNKDGSSFDLFVDGGLPTAKNHPQGAKLHKRYPIDKHRNKEFEIAQLQVLVSGMGSAATFANAEQGFKVAAIFNS